LKWLQGGLPAPFLFSAFSSRRLCRAFGVQVSGFRFHPSSLHHKLPEYSSPPAPPQGWSGTTPVPPWYLPIPIVRPKKGVFNEASLYLLPIGSFLGISPWSGTPSPHRLSMSEPAFAKLWVREAERGTHRLVPGLAAGNTKASGLRYSSATANEGVSRRRATARSLCQARASSAESSALSIASARSRPVQTFSSVQKPPSQSRRELRALERNRNKYAPLDTPRYSFRRHHSPNVLRSIARRRSLCLTDARCPWSRDG